jgi:hypothetical protein
MAQYNVQATSVSAFAHARVFISFLLILVMKPGPAAIAFAEAEAERREVLYSHPVYCLLHSGSSQERRYREMSKHREGKNRA